MASFFAQEKPNGKVIGITFDGTGFGLDGNIWGGEFLVGDLNDFERKGHLKYVPMPGGEQAKGFIYLCSPATLRRNRKYAILLIFVIAAILTPTPDAFTQLLMAIPLVFLYEVSILLSKLVLPTKRSD